MIGLKSVKIGNYLKLKATIYIFEISTNAITIRSGLKKIYTRIDF